MELYELTALELAGQLRAGAVTQAEAIAAAAGQIAACQPGNNAFITVADSPAPAPAPSASLLAGVPMAYKDNLCTRGVRTTCASKILGDFTPCYDATAVERLTAAGAVSMGKLNLDEFAMGSTCETSCYGPAKNPWDLTRSPGGSSGGAAAAVAAGEVGYAIGADTGGSIRLPAAHCGVTGMKPTYGMVSRYGVVAFGSSLDQVGPFGRTVDDVALAMNALAGRDPLDCTSQAWDRDFTASLHDGVEGMRIGVIPSMTCAEGVAAEVSEAVGQAAKNLEQAGAELVEVELPNAAAAISAYYVLAPCEAFSNLARFDGVRYGYQYPEARDLAQMTSMSRAIGFGPEVKRRIMLGAYLLSSGVYDEYYYPAQQVRALITQDYRDAFQKVDAILMPSSPHAAFKFGELSDPTAMYLSDMFTISLNIAGNAGVSVPVGTGSASGLPIGAQLIGPAFGDDRLLRVAATLQDFYGPAAVAAALAGKGGELQ